MGGRSSKQKGNRVEYQVRDHLKSLGYEAHRVPASGAAQGFKGDVVAERGTQKYVFEVKARADEFASIYALYDNRSQKEAGFCIVEPTRAVYVSERFSDLLGGYFTKCHPDFTSGAFSPGALKRTTNKLFGLEKMLKGADFLVLKNNNKPLLFVRFVLA